MLVIDLVVFIITLIHAPLPRGSGGGWTVSNCLVGGVFCTE